MSAPDPAPVEELVDYVPAWLEAKGHPELAKLWREELEKATAEVNASRDLLPPEAMSDNTKAMLENERMSEAARRAAEQPTVEPGFGAPAWPFGKPRL